MNRTLGTEVMARQPARTQQVSAADIIAIRLYEAGCRYAFGIPGGEVVTMIDALERAGIRFVLTKHENSAGFMAEGTYHASGAPGILVATLGPGAMNGINVVANAFQDRVPMIVLTGCVDPEEALTYTHQVMDHRKVFDEITKASFTVGSAAIDVLADKAVAIATDGRPGPVHIDVPISAARRTFPECKPTRRAAHAPVAPAEGDELDLARRWIAAAERPIMVAGLDTLDNAPAAAVADFCQRSRIPLVTTYKAKGILAEDDALALGGAGLSPLADKVLLPLLRSADLVLLVGYDPIEMRVGWKSVWDPEKQHVVEIAADFNHHYVHQASISFVADIAPGLAALSKAGPPAACWPDGEIAAARKALRSAYHQGENWGPTAIVETVRACMPRDTVATADSGAHRILMSQIWECYEPRGLLQSSGFCTMGCAVPLALGVKLVKPERPVVAFIGDAGMEMILGELATVRDLKAGVRIVVFVDASLALIEMKQRGVGLPNVGVEFGKTDFAAVAEALGGKGYNCVSRKELAIALANAPEDTFSIFACSFPKKAYDDRF